MTRARTAAVVTLGGTGASWVVATRRMNGMNMGVATRLGSFSYFIVLWVTMMAAMMLPSAAPAVVNCVRGSERALAAARFVVSYLVVWTLVGLAVYALYRPHGSIAAGGVAIAAGIYELTPFKRYCRRRCRENLPSGFTYGICCVGSSLGLMLLLVAVGVMSATWMLVIAVVVLAQKLLPAKIVVDLALSLAVIGLGILIVIAPSSIPGLTPLM